MYLVPSEEQLWLELPEASPLSPRPPIMGLLVGRALEHTGICALLTQLRAGGLKSLEARERVQTDGLEEPPGSGVAGHAACGTAGSHQRASRLHRKLAEQSRRRLALRGRCVWGRQGPFPKPLSPL